MDNLEDAGIKTNDFCFIDVKGRSEQFVANRTHKQVYSLHNLTEIGIVISEMLSEYHPDCIIFDSLSTLLVYQKPDKVLSFFHFIINNIRCADCAAVFALPMGEPDAPFIRDMSMFVDKIIVL